MTLTSSDLEAILLNTQLPNDAWKRQIKKKCKNYNIASLLQLIKKIQTLPPDAHIATMLEGNDCLVESVDTRLSIVEQELENIKQEHIQLLESIRSILHQQNTTTIPAVNIIASSSSAKDYLKRNVFWSDFASKFIQLVTARYNDFDGICKSKESVLDIVQALLEIAWERFSLPHKIIDVENNSLIPEYTIEDSNNKLIIKINTDTLYNKVGKSTCPFEWIFHFQKLLYEICKQILGYPHAFKTFSEGYLPHEPESGNRVWTR